MNKDDFKENRVHGNPLYPIGVYPTAERENRVIFDCHWNDEMEFIVVTEGQMTVQIDVVFYEVNAGEAIFINSGEIHTAYGSGDSPCSMIAVVFHPDWLCSRNYDRLQEKFIDPLIKKQIVLPAHFRNTDPWEQEMIRLIHEICQVNLHETPCYEMTTKALLYLVLSKIYTNGIVLPAKKNHTVNLQKTDRLKQVLSYIHSRYSESIKLKDLADEINMSEEHFCRFFKQMTQKSPVEYINYYRMQKASKYLENSDKKVVEIALDVGFDNLSYFISVFKAHTGYTPSNYRKLTQGQEPAYIKG